MLMLLVCREALTVRLPMLECRMSSSEEDLLCTDDLESIADDLDSIDHDDEYPTTFEDTGNVVLKNIS